MDLKLLRLQLVGLVVVVVITVTAIWLGEHFPWMTPYLPAVVAAVASYVGKQLGVPIDGIVEGALARLAVKNPDKAVSVAVNALQSLPPKQAEDATRKLLASIPPAAQQRVVLVNTTEPPPAPPAGG